MSFKLLGTSRFLEEEFRQFNESKSESNSMQFSLEKYPVDLFPIKLLENTPGILNPLSKFGKPSLIFLILFSSIDLIIL